MRRSDAHTSPSSQASTTWALRHRLSSRTDTILLPGLFLLYCAPLLYDSVQCVYQPILVMLEAKLDYVGVHSLLIELRFLPTKQKRMVINLNINALCSNNLLFQAFLFFDAEVVHRLL